MNDEVNNSLHSDDVDEKNNEFIEEPSDQLEGKFGGIGARLVKDSQSNIVLFPFADSPAAQAGILDGDHLIAVGSMQITSEISMDDIQAAIREPVDQIVSLTIARPPSLKQLTFQVKRKEFSIPSTNNDEKSIIPTIFYVIGGFAIFGGLYWGYSSGEVFLGEHNWDLTLYIWIATFISSMIFIGFGKIIELLLKILNKVR